MLSEKRRNEVIELCQKLIKAKSYSGEENLVVDELKAFFESKGFTDITVDKYGNFICKLKGNREGKKILFDGHIDTVPVTDPSVWTYDPFGGEIVDGKIYGRGTTDMKGAVAAMACAAVNFIEETKGNFAGEVYLAGVVHEECFEGIGAREVSKIVKPDYVVIGEASDLNVKIGQRGRGEIKLEVFGIPAHSANPEKGVNAVYKIGKIIEEIRKLEPTSHPILGKGILELTDIKSGPYPGASVVPEYCMATYDRRLLVNETMESVIKPLQDLIDRMMAEDKELKAKVSYAVGTEKCYTNNEITGERFFPGWIFDKEEDFIQDVVKGLQADGFNPEITQYNFCTNGSHYAGEAGVKTIGMGPSNESLAHTIDEYVSIDELTKVTECYFSIMKSLLK